MKMTKKLYIVCLALSLITFLSGLYGAYLDAQLTSNFHLDTGGRLYVIAGVVMAIVVSVLRWQETRRPVWSRGQTPDHRRSN